MNGMLRTAVFRGNGQFVQTRVRFPPALAAWALAGLVAGVAGAALYSNAPGDERPLLHAATGTLTGCLFIGAGLFARWRLPRNRMGVMLAAIGFTWLAGGLNESDEPLVYIAGELVRPLFIAVTAHMMLAFPSGRMRRSAERIAAGALYLAVTVLQLPLFLVTPYPNDDCNDCARNPLALTDSPALAEVLGRLPLLAGIPAALAVAVILARRWRAAGGSRRRAMATSLWAGAALFVLVGLTVLEDVLGDPVEEVEIALELARFAVWASVPFVLVAGLVAGGPAGSARPRA